MAMNRVAEVVVKVVQSRISAGRTERSEFRQFVTAGTRVAWPRLQVTLTNQRILAIVRDDSPGKAEHHFDSESRAT